MNNFIFSIVICSLLMATAAVLSFFVFKDETVDNKVKLGVAFILGFSCMMMIDTVSGQYHIHKNEISIEINE